MGVWCEVGFRSGHQVERTPAECSSLRVAPCERGFSSRLPRSHSRHLWFSCLLTLRERQRYPFLGRYSPGARLTDPCAAVYAAPGGLRAAPHAAQTARLGLSL